MSPGSEVLMAFRKVTMVEVKEILRQWLAGTAKKRIAARLGCDPKTVRRYVRAAETKGLKPGSEVRVSDALVLEVIGKARRPQGKDKGVAWGACESNRDFIKSKLDARVRLSKVRRLLKRKGIFVPYPTLHRFAVQKCDFGRRSITVPVADGKPGEELQVDTGWMTLLKPDALGRRRRIRAWIFTPSVSRYRFVYPCLQETTETAIEACEAAWEFYGGVFKVLIPDNTKAIINKPDPLHPTINTTFLEYSQSRDFVIDPARVRKPKDKAKVERAVRDVRDDCFGGENIKQLPDARRRALTWCRDEYGMRRHSKTQRMPREYFYNDEKNHLLPEPIKPFDIPVWNDPKVGPDLFAVVAKGFYSLPAIYKGKRLRARADSQTVRFYDKDQIVRSYMRVGPGQQQITPEDYPEEKLAYARRDLDYLRGLAAEHGEHVGGFADKLLEGPLPWTRMRRVRALLSLVKKYGVKRVAPCCETALDAEMHDLKRLTRMVERSARPTKPQEKTAKVIPIAKYLRDPSQYSLPLRGPNPMEK